MSKLGFHYYPDTFHYAQQDLDRWLPELLAMKVRWLVLKAPVDRAIPEGFLRGLLEAGIEPVLQFSFTQTSTPAVEDIDLLLKAYARWGVQYVSLFDSPNEQAFWRASTWAKSNLVERFLDLYLPLANRCLHAGLTPLFPPLKPGGDYWDTSFLRAALEGIKRRGFNRLLTKIVIGADAWAANGDLNWGAGGPERWPGARPYFTPPGEEDHRGFRIFDWYNAIVQSVLVDPRPIFLFHLGCPTALEPQAADPAAVNLRIARLLLGEAVEGVPSLPEIVMGGAFWLLAAEQHSRFVRAAWYSPQDGPRPVVDRLKEVANPPLEPSLPLEKGARVLDYYVLLPSYGGQVSDFYLDWIRPLIKKHKPTIGFSIHEAQLARRVTVVGEPSAHPEESIRLLRDSGCIVDRIAEGGTDIAS